MHEFAIIRDIVIILLVSIPIIFIFKKLNLPSIVGFLIAGMIIGPYGFQLISEVEQVEVMAEIGVILLLFTIGLEVSFSRLLDMKRLLLIAGGLQVLLTILFSGFIFFLFEVPINKSIYYGMLISLSSTAIVLKLLSDKDELEAPHGKISLSILIFQDLAIVPMFLLLPILAVTTQTSAGTVLLRLFYAFGAVALILITARFLMPKILYQLANLRMREAFTVGILLLLLGSAYLTYSIGLSFALGAFIAGIILSETDLSHQVAADILPLKDAFNSIFFVSVGLLLNLGFVIKFPLTLTIVILSIFILKSLIVILIVVGLKFPLRTAILTGLGLAQIGEFSFILAQAGLGFNLIENDFYNSFLAASIFTMLVTPLVFQALPLISTKFSFLERKVITQNEKALKDHVIIVGFGLNGRNLARVLKETGINYIITELNPETVRIEKAKGEKIIYGDVTKEDILSHAYIETANILVLAISDPSATRIGLQNAKRLNPSVYTIVRTRYTREIDGLRLLGADEVIPEEFETSLHIFSKVLERYHIPLNIIMKQVSLLRGENYSMLTKEGPPVHTMVHINEILAAGLTDTFYIDESNIFAGKMLSEINLRAKTDSTIIAIVRDGKIISNPSGKDMIFANDTIVITGTHKSVDKAFEYLSGKKS
ncbi:MAG TPA: cation:proton antiporter [Ignavibacteriaceae bacterium]|nr:cation:proton antiporter [Ignavibacteriaceae bacterium]